MQKRQSNSPTKTGKNYYFLICLASCLIFLTGCVRYDLGINFQGQHSGTIVQHIKLGKQLTSFSQVDATELLSSLEGRAKSLQGKIQRLSSQEIVVTIPFNNGKELESKFNQFFNSNTDNTKPDAIALLKINSQMSLHESNLLLLQRERLSITIDLQNLGVLSQQGNLIVSPGSLIHIDFSLNTPWSGRNIVNDDSLALEVSQKENELVWSLQPGQINQIDVVFWLPSYLGLGTVVIILLVLVGFYVKYKKFPWTIKPRENFSFD